ncbi:MAG: hypothetical protein JO101_08675, partial [Candidatus Eremiobacteraeota bacterium]|nr:hypothetical protein [Candidatus Eremiobacteraeota bacterium]
TPIVLWNGDQPTDLGRWTTALIPAEVKSIAVDPEASAQALLVTPDRATFQRRLSRSGVANADSDRFLAQFETHTADVVA